MASSVFSRVHLQLFHYKLKEMEKRKKCYFFLLILISLADIVNSSVVVSSLSSGIIKKSLFPNLPVRCPAACTCDTTILGKRRVICGGGGLKAIPTHQMDQQTQVIELVYLNISCSV